MLVSGRQDWVPRRLRQRLCASHEARAELLVEPGTRVSMKTWIERLLANEMELVLTEHCRAACLSAH
jgi:hypothetical protein